MPEKRESLFLQPPPKPGANRPLNSSRTSTSPRSTPTGASPEGLVDPTPQSDPSMSQSQPILNVPSSPIDPDLLRSRVVGQDFGLRDPPAQRSLIRDRFRSHRSPCISGMIPRREVSSDSGNEFEELVRPRDEIITRPNQPLFSDIRSNQILFKHIPRQQDIDKCLKEIKKRCLHDFNVPLKTAELRREYARSSYFCQVYSYLTNGLLPAGHKQARSVMARADEFILVNEILFRLTNST
jgi:hypothetical protein